MASGATRATKCPWRPGNILSRACSKSIPRPFSCSKGWAARGKPLRPCSPRAACNGPTRSYSRITPGCRSPATWITRSRSVNAWACSCITARPMTTSDWPQRAGVGLSFATGSARLAVSAAGLVLPAVSNGWLPKRSMSTAAAAWPGTAQTISFPSLPGSTNSWPTTRAFSTARSSPVSARWIRPSMPCAANPRKEKTRCSCWSIPMPSERASWCWSVN